MPNDTLPNLNLFKRFQMAYNIFRNSLFSKVPDEILISILRRVDSISLIVFCDLYDVGYFLHERCLIGKLDLQRYYSCNFYQLAESIGCDKVTTLNINHLYWISVCDLREFIGRLKNLQKLYAIGTKLGVTDLDLELYNQLRITVLGVTVTTQCTYNLTVPSVRSLYVQLFSQFDIAGVFPAFEKIWVDCENRSNHIYDEQYFKTTSKWYIQNRSMLINYGTSGVYYRNYNNIQAFYEIHPYYITCKDQFPLKDNTIDDECVQWPPFANLRIPLPCGPRDFWKLHHNDRLQTIKFYELFLSHRPRFCLYSLEETYRNILKMNCSSHLKRLHVKSCIFNEYGSKNKPLRRRAIQDPVTLESLHPIFGAFRHLEVFEISYCKSGTEVLTDALSYIKTIKYLKHLSLEVAAGIDEGSLMGIFQNCVFLEIMKLKSKKQNEDINRELCRAIPFGTNLKDLFFENMSVPFDELFSLFPATKIQRLALVCTGATTMSPVALFRFLDANPQLLFMYLSVKTLPNPMVKHLRNLLKAYKAKCPAKVFIIRKAVTAALVPPVHFNNFLSNRTSLLTLQACDEFEDF